MKGSACLLEFKTIDTKCKQHWLWVTLRALLCKLEGTLHTQTLIGKDIGNFVEMQRNYTDQ